MEPDRSSGADTEDEVEQIFRVDTSHGPDRTGSGASSINIPVGKEFLIPSLVVSSRLPGRSPSRTSSRPPGRSLLRSSTCDDALHTHPCRGRTRLPYVSLVEKMSVKEPPIAEEVPDKEA
ncbi:hypothetical protein Dimus_022932 [Dionaea muscipula]